jgi:phospholysine phosphohistidine inorganic pyrophosphate phosphatase
MASMNLDRSATAFPIQGCLFDLDGTLYQGDEIIHGVGSTLAWLQGAGVPYRFVTNTTRRPRSAVVAALDQLGIPADPDLCLTAPRAAADWLEARQIRRILPLLHEPTLEDLPDFTIDRRQPECVLVGDLGESWSFDLLNEAFGALMRGAELVAIQKNRYWRSADGLVLDAGAFVAALEFASGKTAKVVGKPSAEFYGSAIRALGLAPERVVMVGDDLEGDVVGARAAGLRAVAVRTGKYRPADEQRAQQVSDAVLDSVAALPAWLESLAGGSTDAGG